jgi:hypothetical protein
MNPVTLKCKLKLNSGLNGYKWTGLKLPAKIQLLKHDMKEKEEYTGGEYDIGIAKYFKLVSSSIDQSIFED